MKINLQQLSPKETKISFEKIPHEFTVGKITLADDAWMLNEFGGQAGIVRVFETGDLRSIVRIFFRLLNNDDKLVLSKINLVTVDEDGNELEIKSNIDKLLYLIQSPEVQGLIVALLASRGASLPEIAEDELEDDKKKEITPTM